MAKRITYRITLAIEVPDDVRDVPFTDAVVLFARGGTAGIADVARTTDTATTIHTYDVKVDWKHGVANKTVDNAKQTKARRRTVAKGGK